MTVQPTVYEELAEQGFSPQQIEYIMELVSLGGESPILKRDRDIASEYRGARVPRGRYAGGTYVAAHPLEHLGTLAQQGAGVWMDQRARNRQLEVLKEIEERRIAALGGSGPSATAYPLGTRPGIGTSGWRPYR